MSIETSQASETFVSQVHSALQYLYEPSQLRRSPLLALFDLNTTRNPVAALGKILAGTIQALKPATNVPLDSGAWRNYHLLTHRFVDHMPQKQVAVDLGFSERQMRRQEKAAVDALANHLWDHYHLAHKEAELLANATHEEENTSLVDTITPDQEDELAWLKGSFPNESADVAEVITTALRNAASILERSDVRVECKLPDNRPPISGQLPILRLALLNLVTAAAYSTPGGVVRIAVQPRQPTTALEIRIAVDAVTSNSEGKVAEYLRTAHQLVQLFGGQLETAIADGSELLLAATVTITAQGQVPILVIDDNVDTLRLLQRCLAGTHYQFIGSQEPVEAVALAIELKPQVIVLDIMLPGIDGLDLLGRFREHPQTRNIPVVICSIMPQEEIVMTLGAAGFLRKPVSRTALLSMLDRQMALYPQELP